MAISDLRPRKAARNKTRRQTLHDRLDYDEKAEKTEGGTLVSSYMCSPETAAEEFETSKLIYEAATGRKLPADKDIIAYRILQSFKPGEITPEEANRLGYELAMKFTKGKHQFVVSTHVDKAHIHTHIEFNSTNLECDGKFKNFKNSSFALRRLNDQICREHGYSVIGEEEKKEPRQNSTIRYPEKAAAKRGRSYKERLRQDIDRLLPGCGDLEEFLSRMRAEGYEVKRRGKSLEFRAQGQERFTRSFRLGEGYTEEALHERIGGTRTQQTVSQDMAGRWETEEKQEAAGNQGATEQQSTSGNQKAADRQNTDGERNAEDGQKTAGSRKAAGHQKTATNSRTPAGEKRQGDPRRVNLLVDIQAKLQAGKGKGYEQWAKVFNLKEAAKTINFLTENGVTDYGQLEERTEAAGKKFDSLSARIKQLEGRMEDKARMKMHIISYAKTRDIYAAYKKTGFSERFREQHREEIEKHEAAKAAFDALGGQKIPKVADLTKEYAALLAEKKECYEEYKAARKEMIEYQTAKMNVDRILGIEAVARKRQQDRKTEKEV